MKQRFKKGSVMCLIMAMIFSMLPLGAMPTYAGSNSSAIMHLECTINLPSGMTVPEGKTFSITVSGYSESLSGSIEANQSSTVVTGDIDVAYSPYLYYTITDDSGLNVVSDGWYDPNSSSKITHNSSKSYRFGSENNDTTQKITLDLEAGIPVSGTVTKPNEITLSTPLTVKLVHYDSNNDRQYMKSQVLEMGQSQLAYRTVVLPSDQFNTGYSLYYYDGKDIVRSGVIARDADYKGAITDQTVALEAGVEISGILSLPDNIPTEHSGYNFYIFAENELTHSIYSSTSNFYSATNFSMVPKARSMTYSIIVPKGSYKVCTYNQSVGENNVQSFASKNKGGSTKESANAQSFNVQEPTQVNFVGLFTASSQEVTAAVLSDDVMLSGFITFPEDINEDFSLRLSIDSHQHDQDYDFWRSFDHPKAGAYPYTFIVPKALIEADEIVVKAYLEGKGDNGSVEGYMQEIYLSPTKGGTFIRNEGKLPSNYSGAQTINFSAVKGSYVKISTKISDTDEVFSSDTSVKYLLFDSNDQLIADNSRSVKIPSDSRLAEEDAYVYIPESVASFKIGARCYDNSVYNNVTFLGASGSTRDLQAAKAFTHQDLATPLELVLIPATVKTVTGTLELPDSYLAAHPELSFKVFTEKTSNGFNTVESMTIPENSKNGTFTLKIPSDDLSTFALSFQSNIEGVIQRQFYNETESTKTIIGYGRATDLPVGNQEDVLDLGTIKLLSGTPVDITFSNPQNISEQWAEIQVIDADTDDLMGNIGYPYDDLKEFPKTIKLNMTGDKPFIIGLYQYNNEGSTYLKKDGDAYIQVYDKSEATIFSNIADATNLSLQLMPKSSGTTAVPVTGVTLNKTTLTLKTGDLGEVLTATIAPNDASNKTMVWSSADTNVATVSNQGLVTPVAAGTAQITVTTVDGNFTASCNLKVEQSTNTVPVQAVTISQNQFYLSTNSENKTFTAQVSPVNATTKTLAWTSSEPSVATIDAVTGVLTVVGRGTTTITATAGGVSGSCTVIVRSSDTKLKSIALNNVPISNFDVAKDEFFLDDDYKVGQPVTISAEPQQNNATVKVNGVSNTNTLTLKKGVNVFTVEVTAEDGNKKIHKVYVNVPIEIKSNEPVTIDSTTNKMIQIPQTMDKTQTLEIAIQKSVKDAELMLGSPADNAGKKTVEVAGALSFRVEEPGKDAFKVEMPAEIKISSAVADQWNGKISLPTVTQDVQQTTVSFT